MRDSADGTAFRPPYRDVRPANGGPSRSLKGRTAIMSDEIEIESIGDLSDLSEADDGVDLADVGLDLKIRPAEFVIP